MCTLSSEVPENILSCGHGYHTFDDNVDEDGKTALDLVYYSTHMSCKEIVKMLNNAHAQKKQWYQFWY